MELGENNDKKFYSLVNHQRQQNSLITSKLKYNAITITFPVIATLLFPFPVEVLCLSSQI
jgi:hypothetical protein